MVVPEADAIDHGDCENDPTFRLARRVIRKGVGWIMLNHGRENLIEPLRAESPTLPIAIVSIDNVGFGQLQARQLRALLPKGGTVLYVRATVCVTLPGQPALELLMNHWRDGTPLPPVTRLAVESYPRLTDLKPMVSC